MHRVDDVRLVDETVQRYGSTRSFGSPARARSAGSIWRPVALARVGQPCPPGVRRCELAFRVMSGVVYFAAMSLDGYIAEADDTIKWLTGFEAVPPADGVETVEGGVGEFYEGIGALVAGSVTYEWVLGRVRRGGSWPYAGKPCWVLSSRELPQPDGGEVEVANASVTDLYDEMIAAAGERKLWVLGGGNVASQFADAGLLEEVWVTIVPVVLGVGKPLFARRFPVRRCGSPPPCHDPAE